MKQKCSLINAFQKFRKKNITITDFPDVPTSKHAIQSPILIYSLYTNSVPFSILNQVKLLKKLSNKRPEPEFLSDIDIVTNQNIIRSLVQGSSIVQNYDFSYDCDRRSYILYGKGGIQLLYH